MAGLCTHYSIYAEAMYGTDNTTAAPAPSSLLNCMGVRLVGGCDWPKKCTRLHCIVWDTISIVNKM